MQQLGKIHLAFGRFDLGAETDAAGFGTALLDDLVEAGECAAADEQHVLGIDLQELLLRVLAAALRRHRCDGTLDQLQQSLLHAFAGNVTGDRSVFRLAGDLVDFIDVDDAGLRFFDIVIAFLQELLDDVLDVLADIAGLGQRRGIGDGERYIEQARQRFGQQGLARAGRTDQQDVGLGQLDVVVFGARLDAFVMVVNGHGQRFLGARLADHVLVQNLEDFLGFRQMAA